MAVLPIRMYPDPVLREPTAAVEVVDDDVRKLIADMGETMRAAPGIGLAAPQVGVQRRVFVYALSEEDEIVGVVNPEIVVREGEVTDVEACLSIPGVSADVTRAQRVVVRGLDANGDEIEIDATDLEARCMQHEIDHLDGVLYIDRLEDEQRKEVLRFLRERAMGNVPAVAPSAEVRQPMTG
ncbi:MAG: peptide deformylase [Actinomycetota bacterium]